jgi:hypothetical protein
MKKLSKLIALTIAIAMLLMPLAIASDDTATTAPTLISAQVTEPTGVMPGVDALQNPIYSSLTGEVTVITERDDFFEVTVSHEDGVLAVLVINSDTIVYNAEFAEGAVITAFYFVNLPMTRQYPPRYFARIVVAASEDLPKVTADLFVFAEGLADYQLISSSGELVLNIGEDTVIVDLEGNPYTLGLIGQHLLVFYAIETRSIPPQTPPEKIVVLGAFPQTATELQGLMPTVDVIQRPVYASVTGVISEINEREGITEVTINHDEGGIAVILIDADTIVYQVNLEIGARITAFFYANLPMTLQYPPRYSARIVVDASDLLPRVTADLFVFAAGLADYQVISHSGELVLNIGADTLVIDRHGNPYAHSLVGHHLLVFYSIETMSIPPQTPPDKVVVLDALTPPEELIPTPRETDEDEEITVPLLDLSSAPIIVLGEQIVAPPPIWNDDGLVLLPLRAIANALGWDVAWDGENRTVTVADEFIVRIDSNLFLNAAGEISLTAQAIIHNDLTYVPVMFFSFVGGLNNSYFFEGEIVINNEEAMEMR